MGSDCAAAQTGPDADLNRLYRDNHRWLLDLLRRKLDGDAHNAADLAHDVFERILRTGAVASVREPRAYLTTVASRLTANYYRRDKRYWASAAGVGGGWLNMGSPRSVSLSAQFEF